MVSTTTYSPKETLGSFICHQLETLYASGANSGTTGTYAMGSLGTTGGSGVSVIKGVFTLPTDEAMYDFYRPTNYGANQQIALPKGIVYKDGSIPFMVQNYTWLIYALAKLATVGGGGIDSQTPTFTIADAGDTLQSFILHHFNGLNHFECYGTQVSEYSLNVKQQEYAIQTVALKHYRAGSNLVGENQACNVLAKVPFLIPYPVGSAPAALCHANFDLQILDQSNNIFEYLDKEFTLDIKNNFDSDDNSDNEYINNNYRLITHLKNRDISIDITFRGADPAIAAVLKLGWSTFDQVKLIIATNSPYGWTSHYINFSQMIIKPGTANYNEYPEQGFFEYKATYVPATGNAITFV